MALPTPRPEGARALALALALAAGLFLLLWVAAHARRSLTGGAAARREAAFGAELAENIRKVYRRWEARHRLARAVSRGELPLLEAAGGCLALNRGDPPFDWDGFRRSYEGASDEERVCRYVIDEAAFELGLEDPCAGAALRAGLERELEAHLRRGPLTLPDVGRVTAD
jgi:hypothetical protein